MHPEQKEVKICKQTSVHKFLFSDNKKKPRAMGLLNKLLIQMPRSVS
jgi:hypothetical protein